MISLGSVPASTTIYIPFSTYAGSTGASVTCTGLAVTDIEIYKNGSVTQRSSDAGYTLLDTDGIDFDGITGLHGFSIDLSDNTDAGFYAVGSWYWVVVSAITVDSQTVTFLAAVFRIAPAEALAGHPKTDVGGWLGTAPATPTINGVPEVDITHLLGTAWLTPATAGTPDVNAKLWNGLTTVALPLVPTVAGRTLNIEAGGRAGINWADIANPTQIVTLSGTVVVVSSVQTGGITTASFAAGAINAAAIATDACDEIADHVWDEILSGHVSAGSTGEALSAAGGAGDPWITALPGAYGAGTAGKIIGDNINATISSRATQSSVDTIDDFLDTEIAAIKAKTDNLPTDPADQSAVEAAITAATSPLATAANLATVAGYLDTEIAAILADTNELQTDWANGGRLDLILDARASQTSVDDVPTNAELATALTGVFTTQMTESYAADGVAPTPAQALFLIQQAITEFSISSTTTTIKKIDGTTTAATLTLNSATTPTAVTRST